MMARFHHLLVIMIFNLIIWSPAFTTSPSSHEITSQYSSITNTYHLQDYNDIILVTPDNMKNEDENHYTVSFVGHNKALKPENPYDLLKECYSYNSKQRNSIVKQCLNYILSTSAQLSSSTVIDIRKSLENKGSSLISLLLRVIEKDMADCDLVIAYDDGFRNPEVLQSLLALRNQKQVLRIATVSDMLSLSWESTHCSGYVMLLSDPQPLISFGYVHLEDWDYSGRYLFVLPSTRDFEAFTMSVKGKKTEHLAAVIQSEETEEWKVYVNQLFRSESIEHVTTWRGNKFTRDADLYSSTLSNLQGSVLKAVTFEWEPSVFYYRSENGSVLYRYGVDIGVVKTISEVLNFTIHFQEPPANEYWGRRDDNGSFNGLMGTLDRNEVDMGVVDIYVTLLRFSVLTFTSMYENEMSCFLAKKQLPVPRWQALSFPFQQTTWLALIIGLFVSGPVLYLLSWASSQSQREVSRLSTLPSCWYYVLGMHTCESHPVLPRNRSTQVFIVFLWLYTMILTIAYSSNLTAFLTVDKPQAAIETILELQNTKTEVSGIGKDVSLEDDNDINMRKLAGLYKGYDQHATIIKQVLRGKSVFMANRLHIKYMVATLLTPRGSPRVRMLRECFLPFNIGVALQRHSPLKRNFDKVIGWMKNGGLVENFFDKSLLLANKVKAQKRERAKKDHPQDEEGHEDDLLKDEDDGVSGVIPIGLDHLQSIFYIYFFGCLVSTLAFLGEACLKR